MRDPFLSAEQKIRIRIAVLHKFGIRLMSLEEEYEYPAVADRKIMDARSKNFCVSIGRSTRAA
jgi:hypothetical protein